ncbi:hypothetical protein CHUAL_014160 [Chamberlinius hualienensis]
MTSYYFTFVELSFSFINELVERIDDLNRKPVFVMAIHPYGTAPILHPSRVIRISPGDFTTISMTQSVITRLPSPYQSKCVDGEDVAVKNTTIYYRPYKQYIYSHDACVMTCEQRLRMENCGCIDQTIPVSDYLLQMYKDLPMCLLLAAGNHCYTELVNTTQCNCPVPCKETRIHTEIITESIANENNVASYYNQLIPSRFLPNSVAHNLTYKDGLRDSDKFRSLRSTVTIRFKSTVYEEVTELPKITITDFLGFIGGNIGLWLGISIISIFDIFEYVSLKVQLFYRAVKILNPQVKPINNRLFK